MTTRELLPYLLGPVICGLIGWLTNWLAVKMLFHPRYPVAFGPLVIHGVFPKRQAALAARLGALIKQELVRLEEIADALRQQDLGERFRDTIDEAVDKLLTEKLVQAIPMAAMLLSDSVVRKIKATLVPELLSLVPSFVDRAAGALTACYDVEEAVRKKVEAFPVEKLENVLFSIMRKEFRFIELSGAVLGFAVGVLQSLLFWFLR